MEQNFYDLFLPYINAILARKSINPVMIDVRGLTSYTDALIICSANSSRHVVAIAEHVKKDLKKKTIKALSIEGLKEGHWVLMDYGDIILHIFYEPERTLYDLEGLWIDADIKKLDNNSFDI